MVKKRSVFDINFELDDDEGPGFPAGNQPKLETKSSNAQGHPLQDRDVAAPTRRGPMASAIVETAEANADRAGAEALIRAENDALAHEHVRLKKLGLITDLIDTAKVRTSKLTRDRSAAVDPELEELKRSIQSVGLSNPIRVEETEQDYELVQGFRRLNAFRELADETGDARYTRIPATMVPRGEPLADLYRKMVDENLVRKDLSFGEMAGLAIAYAQDAGLDVGEAVSVLYASALKQKRTYIRQFAHVLEALGDAVRHPEAIPRALGLELYKAMDADPALVERLVADLAAQTRRDAPEELHALRDGLARNSRPNPSAVARPISKTSLRLNRPEGEAKVTALDGRLELKLERDFSAVSKERLQKGIEALLAALDR